MVFIVHKEKNNIQLLAGSRCFPYIQSGNRFLLWFFTEGLWSRHCPQLPLPDEFIVGFKKVLIAITLSNSKCEPSLYYIPDTAFQA